MAVRPKIGLSMRLELETRRFYLGRDYSEAVFAAGGLPIQIPLIADESYINEVVDGLDGLLLPGADCDPDPARYGEDPHPKLGRVIPEKDETDLLLLTAAERRGLPILGICFGMQILNVHRGGSLIQDIESQVESPIKHRQGLPLERASHSVLVRFESKLSRIMASAGISGEGGEQLKVNSHHHQAVKLMGRNLINGAMASDGVIESIEDDREDRFVLGVQWHPELSWRTDPVSAAIFERFVDACRT
ncbi:MAG: gamma-glutamyl-gamma-aminobutyrate hydrolase family protein [Acidobacteria bacterium]|nr:gamma-glutamyl-gamma-aminobutyrate hydrolase family protein [Acidobacteriota bacterium]